MKRSEIAIVVFTYNRLDHTKVTLENLAKNKGFNEYFVTIFSDGPKTQHKDQVQKVREYLKEFKSKHNNVGVIERTKNYGLEKSIIDGISEAFNKYLAVISIEDDIKTSPFFLEYMFNSLDKYEKDEMVGSISGYSPSSQRIKIPDYYKYDVYFVPRTSSWGWATWKNRWEDIDWEIQDIDDFKRNRQKQQEFNKGGNDLSKMLIKQVELGIDTWDIQWGYHNFKKDMFSMYPVLSYVDNIGNDGTGIHCGKTSGFTNEELNLSDNIRYPEQVVLDNIILSNFKKAQNLTLKMYYELISNRLSKIITKYIAK